MGDVACALRQVQSGEAQQDLPADGSGRRNIAAYQLLHIIETMGYFRGTHRIDVWI